MTEIVLVSDSGGFFRWGANRDELLAALNRLGWQQNGNQWIEPEEDYPLAYFKLWQIVKPAPCSYNYDTPGLDVRGFTTFQERDDLGEGMWVLDIPLG